MTHIEDKQLAPKIIEIPNEKHPSDKTKWEH